MTSSKVFLDLDRTLFDTDRAVELWDVLADHYDIVPEVCIAEQEDFFVWHDGAYTHDMSEQLRSYGIHPPEAYEHIVASDLADGRFEIPYTAQLVAFLKEVANVAVLTYGPDEYQRVKAALCPSLRGIPVITTLRPKAEVLAESGQCYLVDDKDLGESPPKNVHLVQVVPPGKTIVADMPWPVCLSLKEVKEYLYEQMH